MAASATIATVDLAVMDYIFRDDRRDLILARYYRRALAEQHKDLSLAPIGLDRPYQLDIEPGISWLPVVERRIQDSIIPDEYRSAESTEWISEEVGEAALWFFREVADVLPAEPYIYASRGGHLVAEVECKSKSVTIVISPRTIILFVVKEGEPHAPEELRLQRASKDIRQEVSAIM